MSNLRPEGVDLSALVVVLLVQLDELDVLGGGVPLPLQDLVLQQLHLLLVVGLADPLLLAQLLRLLPEDVDLLLQRVATLLQHPVLVPRLLQQPVGLTGDEQSLIILPFDF